ncbi:hypothetical protein [Dictyobacter aurantiacus]|uniref:Uncharacterized protein n=1 Tax=Dictyobacter aurantiacus TaxID=1936993 RepID=A0A401ZTA3_9CHLR|nr:hypothetical protein [Dictyobacter aurantiacus]GCE10026.1 hypothetical protein KDAU_73550 [Dictyobacter aurantiacus]
MPDLWIADIPEDVFGSLQTLARSAKVAEDVWMREYIIASLRVICPIPQESYVLHCKGKQGSSGMISRRYKEPVLQTKATLVSPRQEEAFEKAAELVRRNKIGDRELAIQMFQTAFDEVIEDLG